MADEVKAVCKRCKKEWKASELKLDPEYKMVVCPQCIRERLQPKTKSIPITHAPEAPKPIEKTKAGWDEDDEALEKMRAEKEKKPKLNYEKVDDVTIKIKCPKCDFKFLYNIEKGTPHSCPYCGIKIKVK
ncbi:hypothetical protein JXM83_05735 [Candidatus Woesearchaeota archaeon]|nr:hypothetical protein [Candidatus Woesearchaeota archaeon]